MAIDYSLFPIPKPGSGQTKLSPAKYSKHKAELWERQNKRCKKCKTYLADPADAHLHHLEGRGLGGGKRDDRKVALLCNSCHVRLHR